MCRLTERLPQRFVLNAGIYVVYYAWESTTDFRCRNVIPQLRCNSVVTLCVSWVFIYTYRYIYDALFHLYHHYVYNYSIILYIFVWIGIRNGCMIVYRDVDFSSHEIGSGNISWTNCGNYPVKFVYWERQTRDWAASPLNVGLWDEIKLYN